MTDIVDQETRSRMMSGIRGKNTKPELALRRALHTRGFRFRLHSSKVHGRPDLALPKYRAVVFVHGCFWHGHDCPRGARQPKANAAYWIANKKRRAQEAEQQEVQRQQELIPAQKALEVTRETQRHRATARPPSRPDSPRGRDRRSTPGIRGA